MHPASLRCSSVTCARHGPSSRLAIRAPRRPCLAPLFLSRPLCHGWIIGETPARTLRNFVLLSLPVTTEHTECTEPKHRDSLGGLGWLTLKLRHYPQFGDCRKSAPYPRFIEAAFRLRGSGLPE